jgi:hypothetical protein
MSKSRKVFFLLPCILCFVVCLAYLFFFPARGFTEDQVELAPSGPVSSFSGTIELKTNSSVVVVERSFSVTEETVIVDKDGKEIPLAELHVPCEAVIEYRLIMDKDPLCLKIIVGQRLRKDRSAKE